MSAGVRNSGRNGQYRRLRNHRRARPNDFVGCWAIDMTRPCKICFGDLDGPQPCEFIGSGTKFTSHTPVTRPRRWRTRPDLSSGSRPRNWFPGLISVYSCKVHCPPGSWPGAGYNPRSSITKLKAPCCGTLWGRLCKDGRQSNRSACTRPR